MHRPVRSLVALVALGTLLAGCTSPTPSPSGGDEIRLSSVPGTAVDRPSLAPVNTTVPGIEAGLAGDDLTGYLAQKLTWTDCKEGTLCATVLAPVDYADPSAKALTLSLRRKPATKSPKLGTLFINPGGPGGSGKELVPRFESAGLEQYDIVGWDPRGVGDSTPVQCYGSADADAFTKVDGTPDNDAERIALIQATYAFDESCWEHSGTLLEHISTIETVRDLDLLRRLVGDEELHYLGYSYGTQIGAYYAELFPHSVGRMVLDSAVDITNNSETIQAMGFDLALGNFATWCADQQCSLGSTKDGVLKTITALLDRLDGSPIPAGNRTLTQSLAVTGIAGMLYSGSEGFETLEQMIVLAVRGDGRGLMLSADNMNSRDNQGNYGDLFFSFPAISCLDSAEDTGVLTEDQTWLDNEKKAPIFGTYFGPAYGCALWPVRPSLQLTPKGAGAKPIVVIGATGDSATPYQQAVDMAKQLESGVLVTYDGFGHATYGGKSACVDNLVVAYLVDGTVPADGTKCT
ncbi:MAG: alpha/beta hydrolase [Actinobacteria bacterium]|nr:alpha/beta hydrolase [Actinomycetota bacterium]